MNLIRRQGGFYENADGSRGFVYNAPPTIGAMMQSRARAKFIIGPYGSGKTTGCIFHLLQLAAQQQKAPDGYRYTRFAIVRNTLQQLKTTVLKDIQQLLGPIIHYKVTDGTIYIEQEDIRSEWLMIPLDSPEDQRRLLSTQLTGAYVNEFREVPFELMPPLLSRIGRYPSKAIVPPTYHCILGDSNPFAAGTEWFDSLVLNLPAKWAFFKQPGGRSPEAENVENLPPGYYEDLVASYTPEWVKVHVDGEFGDDLSGQAVFSSVFSREWHVAEEPPIVNPAKPLVIGMDFGRTPAAVIGQQDNMGRAVVHAELSTRDDDGMGLETFIDTRLKPTLGEERFAGMPLFVVFDPSGVHKSQINEQSCRDILVNAGFAAVPAPTNDIEPRLRAVEQLLIRAMKGTPGLLINPECDVLIKALAHEYKYKRLKTGRVEDKPDKTHPWSDIADSLQYFALGINSGVVAKAVSRSVAQSDRRRRPVPTSASWT